jgi:hypothetical protein
MIGLILTLCVSSYSNEQAMRDAAYKAVRQYPQNPQNQVTVIFLEASDSRCKGASQ